MADLWAGRRRQREAHETCFECVAGGFRAHDVTSSGLWCIVTTSFGLGASDVITSRFGLCRAARDEGPLWNVADLSPLTHETHNIIFSGYCDDNLVTCPCRDLVNPRSKPQVNQPPSETTHRPGKEPKVLPTSYSVNSPQWSIIHQTSGSSTRTAHQILKRPPRSPPISPCRFTEPPAKQSLPAPP